MRIRIFKQVALFRHPFVCSRDELSASIRFGVLLKSVHTNCLPILLCAPDRMARGQQHPTPAFSHPWGIQNFMCLILVGGRTNMHTLHHSLPPSCSPAAPLLGSPPICLRATHGRPRAAEARNQLVGAGGLSVCGDLAERLGKVNYFLCQLWFHGFVA